MGLYNSPTIGSNINKKHTALDKLHGNLVLERRLHFMFAISFFGFVVCMWVFQLGIHAFVYLGFRNIDDAKKNYGTKGYPIIW